MPRRFPALVPCLLMALLGLSAQPVAAQSFGTEYVTFVRGELRIFATQSNTQVELIDLDTGTTATGLGTNPRILASTFDSWEVLTGSLQRHLRVRSTDGAGGPVAPPVVVWTGQLDNALRHPASPPSLPIGHPSNNPWMSYLPTLRDANAAAGSEVGRDFIGFTSRDVYVFARKGPDPTLIVIQDEITNTDFDGDDDHVLTASSAELIYSDAELEVYFVTSFEDDTIRVVSNVDASVLVGFNPTSGRDWSATPPSFAIGDEGSELGTEFFTFAQQDLSVFPTQDDTQVTITDLSDSGVPGLDDSTSVTLTNGDPANPLYDFWSVVTSGLNAPTLYPRSGPPPAPIVTVFTNEPDAFENDIVKVVANKPVLVYVGPIASNVREFADVAFSVPTGTLERLTYAFAQNGGAEDLQVFAFDPATTVRITSLTTSILVAGSPIFHDFDIPVPSPWVDLPPVGYPPIDDRYWQSGIWRGELLRIESDRPISVITGDYDSPHFGAFIPFVRSSPLLPPIAIAAADPAESCPGEEIELRGDDSFDQDDEGPPPAIAGCIWDFDIATDADSNGSPDDDIDATTCTTSVTPAGCGSFTARLTVTDNEGESDTDDVFYVVGDDDPPLLTCPSSVNVECGPDTEQEYQDWLQAFGCSDDCGTDDELMEFPASGCSGTGARQVEFNCEDGCGNADACSPTFTVLDTTAPELSVTPLEPCYPTVEAAEAAALAGASATDACDASPAIEISNVLDGCELTLTLTARDACGNATPSELTTRVDGDAPVVSPPAPLVLECDDPGGIPADDSRILDWLALASAEDYCGPVSVTHDLSGVLESGCAPGETRVVTFSSVDDCDNAASAESTITVIDTMPPELSVPEPIVLECNSPGGVPLDDPQVQDWLAQAMAADVCGNASVEHDAPALVPSACGPSGQATTVRFTATDDCELVTILESTITVIDTTPPGLSVPEPIVLECNAPGGVPLDDPQVQDWLAQAMAADVCGNASVEHDAPALVPSACGPSGQATTVRFTATDDCELVTVLESTITVIDTTPPELSVPEPIVLECNAPGGVPLDDPQVQDWLAQAMAADLCGGVALSHDAPTLFPSACGPDGLTTVVSFTATDDCELVTVLQTSVTVRDTSPPEIADADQRLACLWPPNHRYVCFSTADFEDLVRPLVSDLCDSGPLDWRFAGCLSDQPDEAPDGDAPGWNGDGATTDDCLVSADGSQVCIRSERAGTGPGDHGLPGASAQDGRSYGLLIIAVDACGNASEPVSAGHVFVPHDQDPRERDCVNAARRGLRPNESLPF